MKHEPLTAEQVQTFLACLQAGMVWSNGLVGRETYRYDGRCFVLETKDERERDMRPYCTLYEQDELVRLLKHKRFPEPVLKALLKRLEEWNSANS